MNMKILTVCLLLAGIFCFNSISAQTDKGFNYQAVARDAAGDLTPNAAVTVRFVIHETTAGGAIVYDETHNTNTNDHGLFDLIIGDGTPSSGVFNNIDWGGDDHFVQVYLNGVSMGTQEFQAVPYAKWAKNGSKWTDNTNGIHYIISSVGIGVNLPTSRLHVLGDPALQYQDIITAEITHGSSTDSRAVYGVSHPVDGYGIAIDGLGGYMGVRGTNNSGAYNGASYGVRAASTGSAGTRYALYGFSSNSGGNFSYGLYASGSGATTTYGVYGTATGGGGTSAYGLRGYATSATNNYGVYATVGSSGTNNWAGYFDGKVQVVNGEEAGLATDGYLELGSSSGANLVLDQNEITARNNSLEATLFLQPNQGNVHVGTTTNWGSRLHVKSDGTQEIFRCQDGGTTRFLIDGEGDVLIGGYAKATGHRLSVDGKIACEEVRVEMSGSWPDYVFEDEYDLPTLDDLKLNIERLGHLPGLPSAASIEEDGLLLGDMQKLMLEKIEELTLYMIDTNEQIRSLQQRNKELSAEVAILREQK